MNWFADSDGGWYLTWFGLTDDTGGIPGTTPGGVGTFALSLENGYTVPLRWSTDIIKARSGREQRISRNDRAKESYSGSAVLLGDQAVAVRNQLARTAASGAPILLGMQHEEALLRADASGSTVYVFASAMALADWKNPGQRVIVVREDDDGELESIDAVIQSTTADSITLDVDPGDLGLKGGRIMPAMPVLLEPQQDFARYPLDAEVWQLRARAARFDFAQALGSLALGPLTDTAGLDSAIVTERVAGSAPTFQMVADAVAGETIEETTTGVVIHFTPGPFIPSSVADIYALLLTSTLVAPTGTWGAGTLDVADEVPETALTGGELQGPVGTGATIIDHADYPVWDREINIKATNTDSVHSLTEIIDHGGVPYAVGGADVPDWGRAVVLLSKDRAEWQWFKKFIAEVKGPQKAWWLSTWRNDLSFVSKATDTITVEGDVSAWYPSQRKHLQIVETSGTVTRAEITDADDNGDGTWTLTIGTTLASSSVRMVSWLEFCRFEKDEFPVTFGQHGFSMSTLARVIPFYEKATAPTTIVEAEASTEDSEPRELIYISINDGITTYAHTTSTRDIVNDGIKYTAIAAARGSIAVTMPAKSSNDLELVLPIDHALCRRYTQQGVPPRKIEVTVRRQNGGITEIIWVGLITSMSVKKKVATFRVPSRAGEWMLRLIPTDTVGRKCPVVVYSAACGASESGDKDGLAFKVTTTVISVSGRDVRVDLGDLARNGTWAEGGKVVHPETGDQQTVGLQTDANPGVSAVATLTMQNQIIGLGVGDTVEILRGCAHDVDDCENGFGNRQNYKGFPHIPYVNPSVNGGLGGDE